MSEQTYRIVSAEYLTSIHEPADLQVMGQPAVAFVGRSNVGKSTLLNAICNRKNLAVTSKTPGRTGALNYFSVDFRDDEEAQHTAHFVDLPGYGYAQVSKKEQQRWGRLIEEYFAKTEELRAVLLLVDARRELRDEEYWFQELRDRFELLAVVTKADKVSRKEVQQQRVVVAEGLGLPKEKVFLTAAGGKKKDGIIELTQAVCRLLTD